MHSLHRTKMYQLPVNVVSSVVICALPLRVRHGMLRHRDVRRGMDQVWLGCTRRATNVSQWYEHIFMDLEGGVFGKAL